MSESLILLGMAVGLTHAFEPDHLAAVSTMITDEKKPARALGLGMSWGLGHALSLLAVTAAIWVFGLHLPNGWDAALEGTVGVMLVGLGIRSMVRARRAMTEGPAFAHQHGGLFHAHAGVQHHLHMGPISLATPSLLVGLLHGLAGSGGLALLVAAKSPSAGGAVLYAAAFGIGAMISMGLLTALVSMGVVKLAAWRQRIERAVLVLSGVCAIVIGAWWTYSAVS